LFKAKEFEDRERDAWMESESSFVWPDSGIELDAIGSIDSHYTLVICPCNTESNDSFWFDESFDQSWNEILGIGLQKPFE
jgi:hypothetical protein